MIYLRNGKNAQEIVAAGSCLGGPQTKGGIAYSYARPRLDFVPQKGAWQQAADIYRTSTMFCQHLYDN